MVGNATWGNKVWDSEIVRGEDRATSISCPWVDSHLVYMDYNF